MQSRIYQVQQTFFLALKSISGLNVYSSGIIERKYPYARIIGISEDFYDLTRSKITVNIGFQTKDDNIGNLITLMEQIIGTLTQEKIQQNISNYAVISIAKTHSEISSINGKLNSLTPSERMSGILTYEMIL
jgi:hypothetical protein